MNRNLNIELKIWGIANICFSIGFLALIKEDFSELNFWICLWIIPILCVVFIATIPIYFALLKLSGILRKLNTKTSLRFAIIALLTYAFAAIYQVIIPNNLFEDNEGFLLFYGSISVAVIVTGVFLIYKGYTKAIQE